MARFSRIYVIPICGIICPLYIIYYYISVRTDLYDGRIFHFILRTSILRCGFIANYGFARRICIEFYSLLVFIGVRTLIRRTGSRVKIKNVGMLPNQITVDFQFTHVIIECRAADSGIVLCILW